MSQAIFTNLGGIVSIPVAVVESNPLFILIMLSLGVFSNVKVFGAGKLTLINSILGYSLYLSMMLSITLSLS